jgi:NADH:ubiquinone oxidoreductase subunit 4 (subunit M)
MSAIMVLLTVIVTLAAVLSGKAPEGKEKLYFGSSLLISAGALGAFAATDLFFFYAFHELALIPTFLMIGMLGRGDRKEIAWKITIYLGLGSIILLAGLVWLANLTGTYDIAGHDRRQGQRRSIPPHRRASPRCCSSVSARSSRSSRSTRGPLPPMPAPRPRSPCCMPAC